MNLACTTGEAKATGIGDEGILRVAEALSSESGESPGTGSG